MRSVKVFKICTTFMGKADTVLLGNRV